MDDVAQQMGRLVDEADVPAKRHVAVLRRGRRQATDEIGRRGVLSPPQLGRNRMAGFELPFLIG